MYFYLFSYSGYECYSPVVLTHTKKYSQEEFARLTKKIARMLGKKQLPWLTKYAKDQLKDLQKSKPTLPETKEAKKYLLKSYSEPKDVHYCQIFPDIVNILETEYGFGRLTYTVEEDHDEFESVAKTPRLKQK